MILGTLKTVGDRLRGVLSDLDPDRLEGSDAADVLEAFAEIEKLAAGGKLLCARRVESSLVWQRSGHRSAAAHLAQVTGTPLGGAIDTLGTARRLGDLPATEEAVRAGKLSSVQVKEIAGAAARRPSAEGELVDQASTGSFADLRTRARSISATGADGEARYLAIRRRRSLRHWVDADGAFRLDATLTPDAGTTLLASVSKRADHLHRQASRSGLDEPKGALLADALCELVADTAGPGPGSASGPAQDSATEHTPPRVLVHVRVDYDALRRGSTKGGEVCEIPGVGPIPVSVARSLAEDAFLSVLVHRGADITAVAHQGRTIPAKLRSALIERDRSCVVPGCDVSDHLEIDHIVDFAAGGPTRLDNLCRLCRWHHYLKTHHDHRILRDGGRWTWSEPAGTTARRAPPERATSKSGRRRRRRLPSPPPRPGRGRTR